MWLMELDAPLPWENETAALSVADTEDDDALLEAAMAEDY